MTNATQTTAKDIQSTQVGDQIIAIFKSSSRFGPFGVRSFLVGTVCKTNKRSVSVMFSETRICVDFGGRQCNTGDRYSPWFKAEYVVGTDEALAKVQADKDAFDAKVADKNKKDDAKKKRDEIRYSERCAVVKRAGYHIDILTKTTLPDGSRVYQGMIPMMPNARVSFKLLIVRVNDAEQRFSFEADEKVEMGYTYVTNESHSFCSVSTSRHATDEDAVLHAAVNEYYHW